MKYLVKVYSTTTIDITPVHDEYKGNPNAGEHVYPTLPGATNFAIDYLEQRKAEYERLVSLCDHSIDRIKNTEPDDFMQSYDAMVSDITTIRDALDLADPNGKDQPMIERIVNVINSAIGKRYLVVEDGQAHIEGGPNA